jgi:hypothetical protein
MSLIALKKKSVVQHGTRISGRAPGGIWHNQYANNSGFSIQGGHRNRGQVGQDMKMSQSGTPFRGMHPVGWGGTLGKYPHSPLLGEYSGTPADLHAVQPLLNARHVFSGESPLYIKPSVLSQYGKLAKQFQCQTKYPCWWVQPLYTGNQTDTTSQGMYIQAKSSNNMEPTLKVNTPQLYELETQRACMYPTCSKRRASTRPIVKTLNQPVSYSDTYIPWIRKECMNPTGKQKPFPFAVSTGRGQYATGSTLTSFGSTCHNMQPYLQPPEWYTES